MSGELRESPAMNQKAVRFPIRSRQAFHFFRRAVVSHEAGTGDFKTGGKRDIGTSFRVTAGVDRGGGRDVKMHRESEIGGNAPVASGNRGIRLDINRVP